MITERMLEIIEETGKLRMQDIENVQELQVELEKAGYNSYIDASTDYLIVEKVSRKGENRASRFRPQRWGRPLKAQFLVYLQGIR